MFSLSENSTIYYRLAEASQARKVLPAKVSYESFKDAYSKEQEYRSHWLSRKVVAIPKAMWCLLPKLGTDFFLFLFKYIQVQLKFSENTSFEQVKVKSDLEEGLGNIVRLVNDVRGSYLVQEACFNRESTSQLIKSNEEVSVKEIKENEEIHEARKRASSSLYSLVNNFGYRKNEKLRNEYYWPAIEAFHWRRSSLVKEKDLSDLFENVIKEKSNIAISEEDWVKKLEQKGCKTLLRKDIEKWKHLKNDFTIKDPLDFVEEEINTLFQIKLTIQQKEVEDLSLEEFIRLPWLFQVAAMNVLRGSMKLENSQKVDINPEIDIYKIQLKDIAFLSLSKILTLKKQMPWVVYFADFTSVKEDLIAMKGDKTTALEKFNNDDLAGIFANKSAFANFLTKDDIHSILSNPANESIFLGEDREERVDFFRFISPEKLEGIDFTQIRKEMIPRMIGWETDRMHKILKPLPAQTLDLILQTLYPRSYDNFPIEVVKSKTGGLDFTTRHWSRVLNPWTTNHVIKKLFDILDASEIKDLFVNKKIENEKLRYVPQEKLLTFINELSSENFNLALEGYANSKAYFESIQDPKELVEKLASLNKYALEFVPFKILENHKSDLEKKDGFNEAFKQAKMHYYNENMKDISDKDLIEFAATLNSNDFNRLFDPKVQNHRKNTPNFFGRLKENEDKLKFLSLLDSYKIDGLTLDFIEDLNLTDLESIVTDGEIRSQLIEKIKGFKVKAYAKNFETNADFKGHTAEQVVEFVLNLNGNYVTSRGLYFFDDTAMFTNFFNYIKDSPNLHEVVNKLNPYQLTLLPIEVLQKLNKPKLSPDHADQLDKLI